MAIALLGLWTAAACEMPSAPDPITVSMRPVIMETQQEYLAWPSEPTVAGGEVIEVRGSAFSGCGALEAEASRREGTIELRVRSVGDEDPCPLSTPAWEPFDVRIEALPPNEYRVRVRVIGHGRKVFSGIRVDGPHRPGGP